MKKIAIGLGLLIGLLAIAKTMGILVNYKLPTTSNEPTLPLNSHLIATSLVRSDIGDFATFLPPLLGEVNEVFVKRLCGLEGDEIEMKNGIFYRNGKNFDENLVLQHSYVIPDKTFLELNKKQPVIDNQALLDGTYQVMLSDVRAKEFGILDLKVIHHSSDLGPPVLRELNEKGTWTRDNFGPLTIPSDMAFFMGDNRHYSYDCRFYGFVPIEDITGTVLWK